MKLANDLLLNFETLDLKAIPTEFHSSNNRMRYFKTIPYAEGGFKIQFEVCWTRGKGTRGYTVSIHCARHEDVKGGSVTSSMINFVRQNITYTLGEYPPKKNAKLLDRLSVHLEDKTLFEKLVRETCAMDDTFAPMKTSLERKDLESCPEKPGFIRVLVVHPGHFSQIEYLPDDVGKINEAIYDTIWGSTHLYEHYDFGWNDDGHTFSAIVDENGRYADMRLNLRAVKLDDKTCIQQLYGSVILTKRDLYDSENELGYVSLTDDEIIKLRALLREGDYQLLEDLRDGKVPVSDFLLKEDWVSYPRRLMF